MKKVLLIAIAFAFVLTMVMPIYAADLPKPIDKLTKGTVEIVKSPLAIYDHTKKAMDDSDFKPLGLFKGLVESPFYVVKRAGNGILDVITFPVD